MKYKKLSFASVLTVLMLIAGCKGDTGPAGPGLSGNITGVVELFNSDGSQPIDRSGVTVSIPGTSFSTTTDSRGQWTLSNLTTGSYTITETKPGYGMSEQQGFQFVGGEAYDPGISANGVAYEIVMAQPPIDSVAVDSVTTVPNSMLDVSFTLHGKYDSTGGNKFLVAIGNDSDVNADNTNSYLFATITDIDPPPPQNNVEILISALKNAGLTSGMTAYLVMYPLGNSYSIYYDIETGRYAYTSLGVPSKVFKISIP